MLKLFVYVELPIAPSHDNKASRAYYILTLGFLNTPTQTKIFCVDDSFTESFVALSISQLVR